MPARHRMQHESIGSTTDIAAAEAGVGDQSGAESIIYNAHDIQMAVHGGREVSLD